ncbi:GFA family protein [Sandaracinobacteroides saxicola]|uniref:GFA family protein n=1 Tax=Sandaracinobacteroides saxicola TaxID=2759707 RepID=A0A7G5IEE0_9SPHN|nr:GFA family protein [Sandaracinobacteroides saxicola]QMW21732.1 GFA family protein [Sandaracinobacteroides saxicola]
MPTAECSCGALRATVPAHSPAVVACHCRACQKRSGSPFGVGAYFAEADVVTVGEARHFARPTASGGVFDQWFCPRCGATIWFRASLRPGMIGIPVGAFADPDAPPPLRSVWEESAHPWVQVPASQHFLQSVAQGARHG